MKKFTLTIIVREHDAPQTWIFDGGFSGIDQLAIWNIVKNLSKKQLKLLLKSK
jgi:hypothetical protein